MITPISITRPLLWVLGFCMYISHPHPVCAQSPQDDVYNTFLGFSAGNTLQSGGEGTLNTFLGYSAGFSNTGGNRNVFVGDQAGQGNRLGNCNIYIGLRAGGSCEGHDNLFLGYKAGENAQVDRSTYVGYQTGFLSTGAGNVFVGYRSGENNRQGQENTYLGYESGLRGIDGHANVFLGYQAGKEHIEGSRNVFLGHGAGHYNESGSGNVFIGHQAGQASLGSNQLWIDNQADSIPLLYGDFVKGGIGINTQTLEDTQGRYSLSVAGRVRAEDLKIFPSLPEIHGGAGHILPSLDELYGYILAKRQLPRLPSSQEVAEQGIFVGELNALLLEKVQELTLYLIAQHKQYEEEKTFRETQIQDLSQQLQDLQKQVNALNPKNKK